MKMKTENKSTLWPWALSFLTGALIGAVTFLSLFGTRVLDVTYEDWLLTEWYDLSQHYVGWKLFRASGWHFPIGLCDNSFYPYYASVIYTDSIPLLSVIFKLLSPLLPETFQFFGLYGLLCFVLQGGLAKLILRRIFNREWQCNLGCIPFVLCAPLIQRMFYHTALASHFLILLAIILFMYRSEIKSLKKRITLWCILGMLCISIHFTIYAIVSVMFAGYVLWEMLEAGKGAKSKAAVFGGFMVPYLASSIALFWLLGGFYGNVSGESFGLGDYSANLNSLFNPLDYSCIIKELPCGDNQYEGLAYIGIAAILMLLPALANIIRRRRFLWALYKKPIISIALTTLLLWVIALSPKIMAGEALLADVQWPRFVTDAWSIFRSSGRFLWPVMYLTIILALHFSKKETGSFFAPLLILACVLQIYEYGDKTEELSGRYSEEKHASFSAERLENCDLTGIKHVQFMHPYYFGEYYGDEIRDQMIGYTMFALDHGMTVSNFHFSRDDMEALEDRIDYCDSLLRNGMPERDTIYVMKLDEFLEEGLFDEYEGVEFIYTDTEVVAIPEHHGEIK